MGLEDRMEFGGGERGHGRRGITKPQKCERALGVPGGGCPDWLAMAGAQDVEGGPGKGQVTRQGFRCRMTVFPFYQEHAEEMKA